MSKSKGGRNKPPTKPRPDKPLLLHTRLAVKALTPATLPRPSEVRVEHLTQKLSNRIDAAIEELRTDKPDIEFVIGILKGEYDCPKV